MREIEVAWVKGRIDYFGGRLDLDEEDEPMEVDKMEDDIPTLEPIQSDHLDNHETIFINDTKVKFKTN
jgi:hypothetical protein